MKMEKVRLGIVGVGNMGSSHATKIYDGECPEIILTAIADKKPEKAEWVKEKFGENVKFFLDADEMFDSGLVDAVIIAIPHYDHPDYAIKAMRKGLHVMVEKPAGVYTKQVLEMNKVADECGVVFALMMNQRTNCIYRKMREIVKSGEMGEIRRTSWIITDWYRPQAYYNSGDWRATWSGEGGGVLLNQCPHNLDLWQWICGMPKVVDAKLHFGKWHDIEVEDDVSVYVEYENGATGTFITTTGDMPGTNRFEITLEKGKLIAERVDKEFSLTQWISEDGMTEPEFSAINQKPFGTMKFIKKTVETDGENPQHMGVMRAFAANILRGEPLVADGREGINGLTLSNSMHLSSFIGKPIEIASFDHERYYDELMKRVATSKRKVAVEASAPVDMDNTFGS